MGNVSNILLINQCKIIETNEKQKKKNKKVQHHLLFMDRVLI